MKKLIGVLALAGLSAGCQPQTASDSSARVIVFGSKPAAASLVPASPLSVAEPAQSVDNAKPLTKLLSADAQVALLSHHNLSDFWRGSFAHNTPKIMNGFFGPEFRRISFVFTSVRRDSLEPGVYHVVGKDRFQKNIAPFKGEIKIQAISEIQKRSAEGLELLDVDSTYNVYFITATFSFRENNAESNMGEFKGTAYLDIAKNKEGVMDLAVSMRVRARTPSLGAGVLYTGSWTGYQNKLRQALSLSNDEFLTAPDALTNFDIGEREPVFNPKYAKLGWNEYWANDEWWTDPPKATSSL